MSIFADTSIVLSDAFGQPIIGAEFAIRRTEPNNEAAGATNHDGFASFWCKCDEVGLPPAFLNIVAAGYANYRAPIAITPTMGMIRVTLTPGGQSLHLEQRGNDFVNAQGQRIVYPGIDGFDDLWFRVNGRESELDALMAESKQIGFTVRRVWCMGDAGENQVFSLYPQNVTRYIDIVRGLVAYENSHGQIPLLTHFVDAQRVFPNAADRQRFDRDLNDGLIGCGAYLKSGGNQHSKNGFNPWEDVFDPGHGVIWSRGSDTDDVKTAPNGAPASELHSVRNGIDRDLMDATASPPNMRQNGSTMIWRTEGDPYPTNGYTVNDAYRVGRACSIDWALTVYHNRQSQRGQLMTAETAERASAFVRGMRL